MSAPGDSISGASATGQRARPAAAVVCSIASPFARRTARVSGRFCLHFIPFSFISSLLQCWRTSCPAGRTRRTSDPCDRLAPAPNDPVQRIGGQVPGSSVRSPADSRAHLCPSDDAPSSASISTTSSSLMASAAYYRSPLKRNHAKHRCPSAEPSRECSRGAGDGAGAGEELQLLRKWKWKLFIDTNKSKANLRELQIKHRQTYLFNEYQRIARSTFM